MPLNISRKVSSVRILAAAAAVACVPLMLAAAPDSAPAESKVPVKQVVLFSSGVGYFEHFGSVQGNAATTLQFKTEQINDILKSLVVQDSGGKVGVVTYPSQDPINKTLSSFQIDLSGTPTLADLLAQLRGAKVTVTTNTGQTLSGTILGVEKKQRPVLPAAAPAQAAAVGPAAVVQIEQLNLVTDEGIQGVDLGNVKDFQLEDAHLRDELEKALAALAASRDKDRKPVTIHFDGNGQQDVRIGYITQAPLWKTSYRLELAPPENPGQKPDDQDEDQSKAEKDQSALMKADLTSN